MESFTVARLNSVNLFDGTNPHYCCLRQGKTEAASAPFSHILFPFLRGWEMKRHFLGKNSLRRIRRSISYSDAPVTQNDYYSVPSFFLGGDLWEMHAYGRINILFFKERNCMSNIWEARVRFVVFSSKRRALIEACCYSPLFPLFLLRPPQGDRKSKAKGETTQ